ncbi:MAG: HAD family hydrolase, partial [Dehalococcoidia bacterium]
LSSEEVRAYKPHVSVFHETCARLGIEAAEAAYVGDTPYQDVEGARHAGLRAVWIDRHGFAWPDDLDPPPDRVSSLAELPELLEA